MRTTIPEEGRYLGWKRAVSDTALPCYRPLRLFQQTNSRVIDRYPRIIGRTECDGPFPLMPLVIADWPEVYARRIEGLVGLQPGWDGYDAAPPTVDAIENAKRFLRAVDKADLRPTRVAASVVGGVGITFRDHDRSAYVEFYNNGRTCLAMFPASGEPFVSMIESDHYTYEKQALNLKVFLHGEGE